MDGGRLPLEAWFWEMPTCTRWWTTATVLMSALVQCQMVTPFQLFYSFRAVFVKSQVSPCFFSVSVWFIGLCRIWLDLIASSPSAFRTIVLTRLFLVLATVDDIPLLRTFLSRPPLPRILSPALC